MRLPVVLAFTFLPFALAACGGPAESSGSTGGTSATGGGGTGGTTATAGSGGTGTGGTGGVDTGPYYVDLTLPDATTPPINTGGVEVTYYEDVAYGSDPQMRFDILLPKSATPTPLMIQIHGGGFVGGDKAIDAAGKIPAVLGQGVAYASLNYRLLEVVDEEGVIKPMGDCRRALQFLRYHAAELNIDPSKVVVKGGSAGAGTSLWLATHDDMAASGGSDPVAKESTRVLAVAANSTQATYDLVKWETVVFADFGVKLDDAVAALGMEQRVASFYGMSSYADLDTPAIQAYRADVDMLSLLSADDPPVYVHNPLAGTAAPATQGQLFHHAYHARAVMEQAKAVGIPVQARIEALGIDDVPGSDDFDFLLAELQ